MRNWNVFATGTDVGSIVRPPKDAGVFDSKNVLDSLYREHFVFGGGSPVTSSHWRSVGWQRVKKLDGGWELEGYGFGSRRKDSWLNRMLRWPSTRMTSNLLHENDCPREFIELGMEMAKRHGRLFDYDCARQVLSLGLLVSRLEEMNFRRQREFKNAIAIIGDGYGYLGSLLGEWLPMATIIEINLGRTLFFDAYYLTKAFPDRRHELFNEETASGKSGCFLYLDAESVSNVRNLGAWLYINIASMQEMDIPVVHDYLRLMRAERSESAPLFYCSNREEKQLPDGAVTKFGEYGWLGDDEIILDELCPWVQMYPKSFPPKWLPFDGPTRHRLVKLACRP